MKLLGVEKQMLHILAIDKGTLKAISGWPMSRHLGCTSSSHVFSLIPSPTYKGSVVLQNSTVYCAIRLPSWICCLFTHADCLESKSLKFETFVYYLYNNHGTKKWFYAFWYCGNKYCRSSIVGQLTYTYQCTLWVDCTILELPNIIMEGTPKLVNLCLKHAWSFNASNMTLFVKPSI